MSRWLRLQSPPGTSPELFGLVDRADGIDVVRPVTLFHQTRASMLLEELEHGHYLVVDGARSQALLIAVSHEVEHSSRVASSTYFFL